MTKKLLIIGALLCSVVINIEAQNTSVTPSNPPPQPALPPSNAQAAIDWASGTKWTNVTALTYFERKTHKTGSPSMNGGGFGITYDVIDNPIASFKPGLFFDYLGAINIASANVSLEHTFSPFAGSANQTLSGITFTTGAYTAVGAAWGSNNTTSPTVEVGLYVDATVYKKLGLWFAVGNRSNSGTGADGNNFKTGLRYKF